VVEELPVQFFQSVIAIRLAATGGVLFQVRYFSPREGTGREDVRVTSATLRPAIAIVLGAPVFGSLLAIPHGGDGTAAAALLVGVSVSILPILLRVLPPLRRDLRTDEQGSLRARHGRRRHRLRGSRCGRHHPGRSVTRP
jgi:hypothetical protein